jgi:L-ascorbate metabolism protein UlaG (beta-lactamase superfamily)
MQAGNKKPNPMPRREFLRVVPMSALAVLFAGDMLMSASCAAIGTAPNASRLDRIKASPNYKDGHFVNPIPAQEPPLLETIGKWISGAENTTPDQPIPVAKRTRHDFLTPPASGLRITWLGHSTSLVEIDGKRLLLDPIWSQRSSPVSFMGPERFFAPPLAFEELPSLNAVLISHDHYDHLDKATVVRLAAEKVPFIVPLGVGEHLECWDVPRSQIIELDWWQDTQIGNLTITATPARHFSNRSIIMTDRNKTLWAGFAMAGPKHRVYYSGDTAMFDGFAEIGKRLGPFDASLIEVGAYNQLWADFHLGPEQAVQALELVRGGLLIPVHWGTFELAMHSWVEPVERLMAAAERTPFPLAVPQPGERVEPASPPALARWWPEVPWQTAEEHPVVSSGLKMPIGLKLRAINPLDANAGW